MNPLQGVLGDAWRLYRARAVRLILIAAAVFLPAMGVDYLIYGSAGSGAWSLLVGVFAAWLVVGLATSMLTNKEHRSRRPIRRWLMQALLSALRPLPVAAILAAIPAGAKSLVPFTGLFAVAISALAAGLMFMTVLAMPAIVTERASALAALRRSWHLVRGDLWGALGTFTGALAVGVAFMIVPIALASVPALAAALHTEAMRAAEDVVYLPFLALVVALTYSRLAVTRTAAAVLPVPQAGS